MFAADESSIFPIVDFLNHFFPLFFLFAADASAPPNVSATIRLQARWGVQIKFKFWLNLLFKKYIN